ncbi:hypothetical protein GWK47_040266 [Chionoecetes opilio]|uniref:Uncharacterized protein n=1 Tax=Chionoecetes opilio TaxID=41210 RepID=A0A8J5CXF4_CHIOP|nr:hypothetical protein GWK47_040266 [Chionoecetes opilio]
MVDHSPSRAPDTAVTRLRIGHPPQLSPTKMGMTDDPHCPGPHIPGPTLKNLLPAMSSATNPTARHSSNHYIHSSSATNSSRPLGGSPTLAWPSKSSSPTRTFSHRSLAKLHRI